MTDQSPRGPSPSTLDRVARFLRPQSWPLYLFGTLVLWALTMAPGFTDLVHAERIPILMGTVLIWGLGTIAWLLPCSRRGQLGDGRVVGVLLLGGFLMRCVYVAALPYDASYHDILEFQVIGEPGNDIGHFGYIEHVIENGPIPFVDPIGNLQFYNPPLFYNLEAGVLGLTMALGVPEPLCFESLQMPTLFFATLTTVVLARVLRRVGCTGLPLWLAVAAIAFSPFFLEEAATVNPDSQAMGFMALTLLCALRWLERRSMGRIAVLGLVLGLGMATKINSAVMGVGLAVMFCHEFFRRGGERGRLVGQYAVFLACCVPLGFGYQVRNLIAFGTPITYAVQIDPISGLNIGEPSLWERLNPFSDQLLQRRFAMSWDGVETNIWSGLFRSGLYDEIQNEFTQGWRSYAAFATVVSALVLYLGSALFAVAMVLRRRIPFVVRLLLGVTFATLVLIYVYYTLSEPYASTMHVRYIPLVTLFPLMGYALWGAPSPAAGEGDRAGTVRRSASTAAVAVAVAIAVVLFAYTLVLCGMDVVLFSLASVPL